MSDDTVDVGVDVDVECAYCVDGMAPCACTHTTVIGLHFHRCSHCQPRCRWCDGVAWFPADFDSLHGYMTYELSLGEIPAVCPCCLGVVCVI